MTIGDVHRLELVPLGDESWRLCDRPAEDETDEALIAYVERTPDRRYETVWVYGGARVESYSALEDVLMSAARRLANIVSTDSKPVPIPHRAPLRLRVR
jgi:hypothetical protein